MDINKIFNLFNKVEIDTPLDEKFKAANELMNFQETPVFWVGMFKKLILNNSVFNTQLLKFLQQTDSELKDIELAGEVVVFLRSWFYISKIDLTIRLHYDAVKMFSDENLLACCKLAVSFFEEREEYEKCSHIKKIQDLVELNLTP